MEEKTKRKKGGQKGNTNAAKPEYYAGILAKTEQLDIKSAGGVEGIDRRREQVAQPHAHGHRQENPQCQKAVQQRKLPGNAGAFSSAR